MNGLLTLSDLLFCKKDVLGKTYECEICGIKAQLHFPVFPEIDEKQPEIGLRNPLLPPQIGKNWKRGDELLFWGQPLSYPVGDSCVRLIALYVECNKQLVNEYASKLYESIEKWEHAFLSYLKLVTKQGLERNRNEDRNNCGLELMDGKYIPNHIQIEICVSFPIGASFATEKQIKKAIAFADSGKQLLLEYEMLLSAYRAIKQNQNRRAILDACSALEIALARQADLNSKILEQMPKASVYEEMSLGERIKLLRKIDKAIPVKDYDKLVVNPRNDLVHGRVNFPTDDTTNTLISCVEEVIKHFHMAYY